MRISYQSIYHSSLCKNRSQFRRSGLRTRKDILDFGHLSFFGKMTRHSNDSHFSVESFCPQRQVSKCPKCPSVCEGLHVTMFHGSRSQTPDSLIITTCRRKQHGTPTWDSHSVDESCRDRKKKCEWGNGRRLTDGRRPLTAIEQMSKMETLDTGVP